MGTVLSKRLKLIACFLNYPRLFADPMIGNKAKKAAQTK